MFNSTASMQMFQSKLTLVLLLVVFVSQLFPTCVASDIHNVEFYSAELPHLENALPLELQQACCDVHANACQHMVDVSEQDEYDNDFHTSCHPPLEFSFATQSSGVNSKCDFFVSYINYNYAPPIPPPHA
ncbi:hypothetical protein JK628_14320 [Shewanella sp. KX20019]|uniref:hypothetical protein n=1 Tax=Shewanella sp. KX20019 TaxID=2803864 RepID=UPI0019274B4C|nr:hypothetical protein [Shewanella sp. KX20019]QQX78740.1 hypothetical protein JK628_14320 [Shewanella sp. KX20019]